MLLQPRRQGRQVGVEWLCALDMAPAVVNIQVLVDIHGPIVGRVVDLVDVVRAGQVVAAIVLRPRVTPSPRVTWHKDQILGAGLTDGVHGGLVVLQNQGGRHIMWLVHQAKDDPRIIGKS